MPEVTASMDDRSATDDHDQALESEPIVRVFSNPARVKILVALVDAAGEPFPAGDIVENANISYQTWYDNKDVLVRYGLVEKAGQVGNAMTFRAPMDSEPVQAFVHLYDALIGAADGE